MEGIVVEQGNREQFAIVSVRRTVREREVCSPTHPAVVERCGATRIVFFAGSMATMPSAMLVCSSLLEMSRTDLIDRDWFRLVALGRCRVHSPPCKRDVVIETVQWTIEVCHGRLHLVLR